MRSARSPRLAPLLALVFGLAFAARLVHLLGLREAPFFGLPMGDARVFDAWAREIAAGDWLGNQVFFQAPLYPYLLGLVYRVLGDDPWRVAVLQALLGAGSCTLLATAGSRLFSPRVGLVAGLLLALYPPAIFFDALLQKPVLVVLLLCLLLAIWSVASLRPRAGPWLALGAVLGGLALTRENAIVLVLPLLLWLGLQRSLPRGRRFALAGALALGTALPLAPVVIRNGVVAGEYLLTTSNFGPNLYIGNNERADGFYVSLRAGRGSPTFERRDAEELAEAALGRELSPREVSAYWTSRALAYVGGHPLDWGRLMLRKLALVWNRAEIADTEDLGTHAEWSPLLRGLAPVYHFGVLAPLAALGMVATWSERRRLWPLYAMLAVYTASVALFFVFARFRMPLVPFLALFAAAGLVRVPAWLRARRPELARALLATVLVAGICNWPLRSRAGARWLPPYNLGSSLLLERRYAEAVEPLREAVRLAPGSPLAHYNLAQALQFTGRLDEAVPHFRAALQLGPELPDVREGVRRNAAVLASLARDAEASGQRPRARILARAALALALQCGDRALAAEIRHGWPGLGG